MKTYDDMLKDIEAQINAYKQENPITLQQQTIKTTTPKNNLQYESLLNNETNFKSPKDYLNENTDIGFNEAFATTAVNKYAALLRDKDEEEYNNKLQENRDKLLKHYSDTDINKIDTIINGYGESEIPVNDESRKLIKERTELFKNYNSLKLGKEKLKEKQERVDNASNTGAVAGKVGATVNEIATKIALSNLALNKLTSLAGATQAASNVGGELVNMKNMPKLAKPSTLSKALEILKPEQGKIKVGRLVAESLIEGGIDALPLYAESKLRDRNAISDQVINFILNTTGNAIGEGIGILIGKKFSDADPKLILGMNDKELQKTAEKIVKKAANMTDDELFNAGGKEIFKDVNQVKQLLDLANDDNTNYIIKKIMLTPEAMNDNDLDIITNLIIKNKDKFDDFKTLKDKQIKKTLSDYLNLKVDKFYGVDDIDATVYKKAMDIQDVKADIDEKILKEKFNVSDIDNMSEEEVKKAFKKMAQAQENAELFGDYSKGVFSKEDAAGAASNLYTKNYNENALKMAKKDNFLYNLINDNDVMNGKKTGRIIEANTPEIQMYKQQLIHDLQKQGYKDEANIILENVRLNDMMAGRNLRYAGIMKLYGENGPELMTLKEVNKINTLLGEASKKGKKVAEKVSDMDGRRMLSLYRRLRNAKNKDDILKIEAQIGKIYNDYIPKDFRETYNQLSNLSYLGRVSTQVKNILGNTAIASTENLNNINKSFIDDLLSKKTGRRMFDYSRGLSLNDLKKEVLNDIATVNEMLKYNIMPDDIRMDVDATVKQLADVKVLRDRDLVDKLSKKLLAIMYKGDAPFKTINYQGNINAYRLATVKNNLVKNGVVKTLKEADDYIKKLDYDNFKKLLFETPISKEFYEKAKLASLKSTMSNDSELAKGVGRILTTLENTMNNTLGANVGTVARKTVIPFSKWASNSVDYVLQKIPAVGTFLKTLSKEEGEVYKTALKNLFSGKEITELEQEYLGRLFADNLTGLELLSLGYLLNKSGVLNVINTNGSADERNLMNSMGQQEYAIKLGDTNIDLSWMGPTGVMVKLGSLLSQEDEDIKKYNESMKEIGEKGKNPTFTKTTSFLKNIITQSLNDTSMENITDTLDILTNGDANKLSKLLARGVKSAIPLQGSLKDIAVMSDNRKRETLDKQNPINSFVNEFKVGLPILSSTLPARKGVLGDDVYYSQNEKLNALSSLTGIKITNDLNNDNADEIARVSKITGNTQIIPNSRNWNMIIDKTDKTQYDKWQQDIISKLELSPEEYTLYNKLYGKIVNEYIQRCINTADYEQLTDLQKAVRLERVVRRAGQNALYLYKQKYYEEGGDK